MELLSKFSRLCQLNFQYYDDYHDIKNGKDIKKRESYPLRIPTLK